MKKENGDNTLLKRFRLFLKKKKKNIGGTLRHFIFLYNLQRSESINISDSEHEYYKFKIQKL